MKQNIHRYAAPEVIIEGRTSYQFYIEVVEGKVVDYGEFREEMAFTEWLGGIIEVKTNEKGLLYACYENRRLK
jgi:hypothetical protein